MARFGYGLGHAGKIRGYEPAKEDAVRLFGAKVVRVCAN
jgi:hypothetical protein